MQVLLSALLFGALLVPNLAWARNEVRLCLVPSTQNRLSSDLRQAVFHALLTTVKSEGATLTPATVAELTACEFPECFANLQGSGATHALHVEASFLNESYSFHLELWEVQSKRSLGSDSRECAICAAQDLVDDLALRAQGLLKRSLPAQRTDLVVPKPAPPLPDPSITQPNGGRSSLGYVGIGLLAIGLGLGAAGAYYLIEDGQPNSDDKTRVRDTKKPGKALVFSGVGALLGGVGLITWHRVQLSTTVAIGPHPMLMATLAWSSSALP